MVTALRYVTTLLEATCVFVPLVTCSIQITVSAMRSMSVPPIMETALSYVPIPMEVISVHVIMAMY